jgi:hypothetical protein
VVLVLQDTQVVVAVGVLQVQALMVHQELVVLVVQEQHLLLLDYL